ncbi:MAG: hypothetical protein FWG98_15155, partial [Candidatus Cloacimonetes bacterium]|nr:hypothetical protein [Candidatus Cloacimonadota bacterium]
MKYFFLIALFIVSLLNAQNHDVWVYNSITNQHVQGDWRSPYWRIIDINGERNVDSPFYSFGYMSPEHIAMGAESDFDPTEGWVLLRAFMGVSGHNVSNSGPTVVLYNREIGIVRILYRHRDINEINNDAIAHIAIGTTSGILSTINLDKDFIFALDKRNNSIGSNDLVRFVDPYVQDWIFMDFYVAYDNQNQMNKSVGFGFQSHRYNSYLDTRDLQPAHSMFLDYDSYGDPDFKFAKFKTEYFAGKEIFIDYLNRASGLRRRLSISNISNPAYMNRIDAGLSFLSNNNVENIDPYVNMVSGILKSYTGNNDRLITTEFSVSTNNQGGNGPQRDLRHSFTFTHSIAQNNWVDTPLYNGPLGVIQMAERAHITKYMPPPNSNTWGSSSYHIHTPPSFWEINPASGLVDNKPPRDVQLSIRFSIVGPNVAHLGFDGVKELLHHDQFDFVTNYARVVDTDGTPIFLCYTEWFDYDHAENIIINTINHGNISDFNVKIRGTFDYKNSSKEPLVYYATYEGDMFVQNNSMLYATHPSQKIKLIYDESEISEPNNFFMNRNYIVDFGGELIVTNKNISPNSDPDYNKYFGFEVRNGKLIVNGGTFNLGTAKLVATGEHSKIYLNSVSGISDLRNIQIKNGAELVFDNSIFKLSSNDLLTLSNGATLNINGGHIDTQSNTIRAEGTNTKIVINSSNFDNNKIGDIELIDGAKLIISNSYINNHDYQIQATGPNTEIIIQNCTNANNVLSN